MRVDVAIRGSVRGLTHTEIESFVAECLDRLHAARALTWKPDEVSVVFVRDDEMTALNRMWRRVNKTTDVLTFDGNRDDAPPGAPVSLGEIVVCLDQAKRQARDQHHSVAHEVRYLLLHGLIHALGFDHESDDGRMDALEIALRPQVGLA